MGVISLPCRDCGGERTKGSRAYEWHLCTRCFTAMQNAARAARLAATTTFDGLLVWCPHCSRMPAGSTCCVCHAVGQLDAPLAAIALTNVWARVGCVCDACVSLAHLEVALMTADVDGTKTRYYWRKLAKA